MGGRRPGPICVTTEAIDDGTLCRQRSLPPGPIGIDRLISKPALSFAAVWASTKPYVDIGDPYKERRYQGAFYKLSEKFGMDFSVLFVIGHMGGYVNTVSPDGKGQGEITNKIAEFDFTSLRNNSDDNYPATLDLQSVMSWQVNSKGKYVKNTWKKASFIPEPPDPKIMVDNPGFRVSGQDGAGLVTDLAAASGRVRFIVRLMIIEKKPIA